MQSSSNWFIAYMVISTVTMAILLRHKVDRIKHDETVRRDMEKDRKHGLDE